MKKNILIALSLIVTVNIAFSQQNESDELKATTEETNRFYYFEIPSSINGSNLDPSAISNVTTNFSASKLSFKLGFPSLFKDAPKTKDLKHSGFIEPSFKATNGVTTLYKTDSSPLEYGIKAGYSLILKHKYWVFLDDKGKQTERHSSESMTWLNLVGSIEQAKLNLFEPDAGFGQILNEENETNGSIYLSINRYFYSKIKRYKWYNSIWSIGLGYAKTNNYSSLKSRTLDEGELILDGNGNSYQSIVKTTSGRIGELIIAEGLSTYGELFIPLIRNPKYGSIYFGNRLTFFGISGSENITNGVSGFYFNLKDKKVDGDKPAKDILNFSITGRFNQLNNSSEDDYFKDNFTVVLQASIPLRFN